FSSRRRHTRFSRDWSSDVCSSDLGNAEAAARIDIQKYIGEGVGEPTLRDIIAELKKPGRDPRADFEPPKFREDVEKLEDLQVGRSEERRVGKEGRASWRGWGGQIR